VAQTTGKNTTIEKYLKQLFKQEHIYWYNI